MESDINYYRRRAFAEMAAARSAVTDAARERRLYLVEIYLQRLAELNAPNPFTEQDLLKAHPGERSAFTWRSAAGR